MGIKPILMELLGLAEALEEMSSQRHLFDSEYIQTA